ncbi:MAG: hypothetical protein ACEQR8_02495 [Cypionkella sp.]
MSQQPKRTSAAAPISAHPAFPAIVALWFAALLGIGSLVLPIGLFERASEASGLAGIVAAAQPPLGMTARLAIALGGAGIGTLLGLAIARRVIGEAPAPKRRSADGASKPPISAHDELFEGGFDAGDDLARFEPALSRAPAAQTAPSLEEEAAAASNARPGPALAEADAPLDLGEFAAAAEADPAWETREARADDDEPLGDFHDAPAAPPAPAAQRPLAELGMAELVERFARALQQHRNAATGSAGQRAAGAEPGAHYPSLLAVKSPFDAAGEPARKANGSAARSLSEMRGRPLRGAPPRRAADDEQSLRDALAKLQKLSGAA